MLLLGLLAGCATKKTAPKKYTYFPSPPDDPRIQFLTTFESDAQLGRGRSFADYIIGESQPSSPLLKPYGLAVHDGKVFVCDTVGDAKIMVFDLKEKRATPFSPLGEGKLALPINISVDQDGTRYVADSGRAQVLIYGPDGTFLDAIGKKDEMKPTDVAITTDRLYITDLLNHCVRVYAKSDHKLLFTIPREPQGTNATSNVKGQLKSPTNLSVDQKGNRLLVSDTGAFAVRIYDLDGNYLRTIGQQGVGAGMFALPKGIAVDKGGHIYVVDNRTQVVQIFDGEGRLLLFFGQAGATAEGDIDMPTTVKVDYDNIQYFKKYLAPGRQCEYLIFVVSQNGPQKVSVYAFLKQKS
jgi:DNA-binding beta-propeller fold protein YncE